MNNVNGLPPFKRLCVTIGNLPSSYVDSMSYYECLMWLCKYLKETVVPAVNENAEAVNDLINWFNNLDVQDEIDNKLDKMVESGELEEIITEYLQVNGVLGYNTVADMVSATNLIDGSICRTLGLTSYKDGKGAFYKIRTITSADTVDGVNIIALNISDTLIAEKIPDYNNDNQIICIGDSYGAGYTPDGTISSWVDLFKQYIGYSSSDFYSNCYGGTGFYATADGKNFQTLLEELDNTIPDKKKIKRIYVLGGYNDQIHTIANMNSAISDFMSYVSTNYPNAKVYVGCVGYDTRINQSGTREALYTKAIPCYKRVTELGGVYLYDIEYILHNPNFMSRDSVHPNLDGQKNLAKYLVSNFNGTQYNSMYLLLSSGNIDSTRYQLDIENITDSYIELGKLVNNNVTTYGVKMTLNLNNATNITANAFTLSNLQTILNNKVNQAQFDTGSLNKIVKCRLVAGGNFVDASGILEFNGSNLTIRFWQPYSSVNAIFIPYQEFEIPSILC